MGTERFARKRKFNVWNTVYVGANVPRNLADQSNLSDSGYLPCI